MKVLIIGAGLMGGSVALALKHAGHEIALIDQTLEMQEKAKEFLKISDIQFSEPDVVIVAVPPSSVAEVIIDANRSFPDATLIDIASVMTNPILQVQAKGLKVANWIPTHPMAGKESSGFENAAYDLFKDRLWVISPQLETDVERIAVVEQLVRDCGAVPLMMDAAQHDQTVALTSHLPQVLSIVLAQQLGKLPDQALLVSGQGLRDMTRIANSSGDLWKEILIANKSNVAEALAETISILEALKSDLDNSFDIGILNHFSKGNAAKARIPGKHGGAPENFASIAIEIDDKPGQLAAIFATAGRAEVNIEDVRIDHALGKHVATIYLFVEPNEKSKLSQALLSDGWNLRSTTSAD